MARRHATSNADGTVTYRDYTAAEESIHDNIVSVADAERPIKDWESKMAVVTRDMPDCVEAVIDSMDEAQLGRLDQVAKDHLAAKKTCRSERP